MSRRTLRSPAAWCVAALLAAASGCAGFKLPDISAQQNGVTREDRKQTAVQRFEESRDRAEYEAAAAAWDRGDAKTCEETLQRLLARNPQHREARWLLADVCLEEDRRAEALAHAGAALQAPPDDAQAAQAVATDADGPAGRASGDAAETLFHNGIAALQQNSPETALACFRQAAAACPDDPQIPISAAATALRFNHPDVAVALLARAGGQSAPSAAAQRILGVAYYRLGDYRSSEVALRQALSLDKSSALTYFLMGCTLAKLGRAESAEDHFRQARAIDPRYAAQR